MTKEELMDIGEMLEQLAQPGNEDELFTTIQKQLGMLKRRIWFIPADPDSRSALSQIQSRVSDAAAASKRKVAGYAAEIREVKAKFLEAVTKEKKSSQETSKPPDSPVLSNKS